MLVILLLIKVNQTEQILLKILKAFKTFFRKKSAKKQINEKHECFKKSQLKINFKKDDNDLLSTPVKLIGRTWKLNESETYCILKTSNF